MPAMAEEEGLQFTALDMDGNEVTEAIFAPYDVTMVNIWATWCGYCVEEMPFFPELKDKLPENANLITICEDASYEPELTKEILAQIVAHEGPVFGASSIECGNYRNLDLYLAHVETKRYLEVLERQTNMEFTYPE
jgi:thiol-disulfide isomerase/thioredoxin